MELVTKVIPVSKRQGEELIVMPVGDIQWAGDPKQIALGMLKRHIAWGVEHNALFLGMGDYIDAFSPSNRQRIQGAALYDTAHAILDAKAEDLVNEVYEILKPSRGRWLGLLEGHHFHTFRNGTTTDQLLADKLQATFLGTSAYVRLRFKRLQQSGSNSVLIWCHHGAGAGGTPAAVLNKLNSMVARFEGDIFLMGHLPRKPNEPVDYLVPVWPAGGAKPYLIHRTKIMSGTGGFLKSWEAGARQGGIPRGGYAEQKMLPPAGLGGIVVRIRPRWVATRVTGGQAKAREMWLPDLSVES